MSITKLLDIVQILIPGLKVVIEKWQNRKQYTPEEINKNVKSELDAIQAWKKKAEEDRRIAYGDK